MLSGGEMQRLGFARLFFHRPKYAIMDEATSALDMELEARCLSHCAELNITMVSVTHRPSAAAFHQKVLRLDGTGSWSLESMTEEAAQEVEEMVSPRSKLDPT